MLEGQWCVLESLGAHLHLIDVGGMDALATACHHCLAATVGHTASLGGPGSDVHAVLPVLRAVAPAALELEEEVGTGGEYALTWLNPSPLRLLRVPAPCVCVLVCASPPTLEPSPGAAPGC